LSAGEIVRVRGFHGTIPASAESIIENGFKLSRNEYDWLGDGVYFFQDAPQRALEWAAKHHGSAEAVGALIRLDGCLDLLDIRWFRALNEIYNSFLDQINRAGSILPLQTSGAHRLDRAVINYAVGVLAGQGVNIRAVRAAFAEGAPAFPGSALFDRAHVQIAVRDLSLIEKIWRVENE
jgi:hypothetical protein